MHGAQVEAISQRGTQFRVSHRGNLYSPEETAARLGVSVACIRGWIYRRAIDYIKVGRLIKISEATIEATIERGLVPAVER